MALLCSALPSTSAWTLSSCGVDYRTCEVTFLPPGSTSHTQPCDISYMRAPKAGLTRAAANHLVSSLIMDPDAAIVLKHSSMELKSMFLGWGNLFTPHRRRPCSRRMLHVGAG